MFKKKNYTVYDDEGNAHHFEFDKYCKLLWYGWLVWIISYYISMRYLQQPFFEWLNYINLPHSLGRTKKLTNLISITIFLVYGNIVFNKYAQPYYRKTFL